jgi:hypothetical protein
VKISPASDLLVSLESVPMNSPAVSRGQLEAKDERFVRFRRMSLAQTVDYRTTGSAARQREQEDGQDG